MHDYAKQNSLKFQWKTWYISKVLLWNFSCVLTIGIVRYKCAENYKEFIEHVVSWQSEYHKAQYLNQVDRYSNVARRSEDNNKLKGHSCLEQTDKMISVLKASFPTRRNGFRNRFTSCCIVVASVGIWNNRNVLLDISSWK